MARSVVDWVKVWSCFTDGDLLPASFALFFSSSFSYFGVRVSASFWFFSVSSAVAGARDWLRSARLLFRFFPLADPLMASGLFLPNFVAFSVRNSGGQV
jgi:hypothetical protein